jgi:hypothetical protein
MRFARILQLAAACASLAVAAPAAADQTVAPITVLEPSIVRLTSPWIATLRRGAASGDGALLVRTAFAVLDDLRQAALVRGCCDPARDYFVLIFVGADPAGAPALFTVLAHDPMPPDAALPGIHGAAHPLYEVFLSDDLASSVQTTYAITHQENPADKQAGLFAAAVVSSLTLPLATRPGAAAAASPRSLRPTTFDVAVTIKEVVLPEAGEILLHETVTYTHPIGHLSARVAAADRDRRDALQMRYQGGAPGPACADLSTALTDRIVMATAGAACGLWPSDLAACTKRVREEIDQAASAYFSAAPSCPIGAGAPLVQELLSVIQDVKPLARSIVVGNAPLIRYGFGLAAAYLVAVDVDAGHPRARLQGGRLVADPFTRELTMGVVNLTPWGYDAQRPSPSLAERARLLAGVAFSPYFGVTAGGAFAINRYLAVNAGYARLWFDAPKAGERIGAAPTAANAAAPFDLRWAGALFLGMSYNFK